MDRGGRSDRSGEEDAGVTPPLDGLLAGLRLALGTGDPAADRVLVSRVPDWDAVADLAEHHRVAALLLEGAPVRGRPERVRKRAGHGLRCRTETRPASGPRPRPRDAPDPGPGAGGGLPRRPGHPLHGAQGTAPQPEALGPSARAILGRRRPAGAAGGVRRRRTRPALSGLVPDATDLPGDPDAPALGRVAGKGVRADRDWAEPWSFTGAPSPIPSCSLRRSSTCTRTAPR